MTDRFPATSPPIEVRFQFETLLADMSARLVKAKPGEFDAEITATLHSVLEFFEADRCGLLEIDTDSGTAHVTHGARAPGVTAVPPELNLAQLFPWVIRRLLDPATRLDATSVIRLEEVPPEALQDRASWAAMGAKSSVNVPVQSGDRVRYLIVLHWMREERPRAEQLVPRLRLLGEILVTALERNRVLIHLGESEARLSLAAASAGAGAWELDVNLGWIWATPEAKVLYGFPPDHEVTVTDVLERVHPEDREPVRTRLRNALRQRASYAAEYRLVLADGSVRWINARGRPHAVDPERQPDRLMGVSVDVTERRQAEAMLKDRTERLTMALASGRMGAWDVKLPELTMTWAESSEDLFGLGPGRFPGHVSELASLLHPDHRDASIAAFMELHEQVGSDTIEARLVWPDGSEHWHQIFVRSIAGPDGPPARLAGLTVDVTERRRSEEDLRRALEEVRHLRDQLRDENLYLQQEVKGLQNPGHIAGQSVAIRRAFEQARQVAPTASTVLLVGETGTGKERLASLIHDFSPRRARPMVRVNCAAIPTSLIESELFGREKGAYTGALSRQAGRFELAHGSTLFLDEIGDLPPEVQVKLLRVLQERQIERLGSPRPIPVDVRIIAATNQNLEEAVGDGRFREDLYYRLNVFPIVVPPLRERREDIPLLAAALIDELSATIGRRIDAISKASMAALMQYGWPGNIRELRNVLERALILATGPLLQVEIPRPSAVSASTSTQGIKDVEREHVLEVLQQTGWRIRGANGAAAILGIKPTTLENRMTRLGIRRPGKGSATR